MPILVFKRYITGHSAYQPSATQNVCFAFTME